ncbi:MAG: DUF1292 domain-containing protein [Bacilli bacterium]|nr:DUF1292 domain-containing protein [Bacilli bacterium]
MEDKFFTMINEQGEEIRYDVLFTFDSEDTNKSYIAYTDNTYDNKGNISVYASTYDKSSPEMKLGEIETEQEWKVIETILNTIQQELQNQQNQDKEDEQ